MATKTRSDNNNNSQKEGGLLEKCTRMKFFPKNYKTNTKVKLGEGVEEHGWQSDRAKYR